MNKKALFIFLIISLFICVSCKENNTNVTKEHIKTEKGTENPVENESNTTEEKSESIEESNASDFILTESSLRKITELEIMQLDDTNLDFARNEIYARKGHIFKNDKYRNYFLTKPWYKPTEEITTDDLSEIEKYNVNFMKFYEQKWTNDGNYHLDYKKQHYDAYKISEIAFIDVNGDGVKEAIIYENLREDGYNTGYKLSIDSKFVEDGEYTNLANFFVVVDIDKSDEYKEIVISDYGPSSDNFSVFYCYDGGHIVKMGETGGLAESNEIIIDGSGSFTAMTRGQILQTWFFNKYYKLTSVHKIIEIPQDVYTTDYDVFVVHQIKLYNDRNDKGQYFDLLEGQIVKIIGTDDKEWCLIETSTGRSGWFALVEYNQIRGEGLDAGAVFAGLCNAD